MGFLISVANQSVFINAEILLSGSCSILAMSGALMSFLSMSRRIKSKARGQLLCLEVFCQSPGGVVLCYCQERELNFVRVKSRVISLSFSFTVLPFAAFFHVEAF